MLMNCSDSIREISIVTQSSIIFKSATSFTYAYICLADFGGGTPSDFSIITAGLLEVFINTIKITTNSAAEINSIIAHLYLFIKISPCAITHWRESFFIIKMFTGYIEWLAACKMLN